MNTSQTPSGKSMIVLTYVSVKAAVATAKRKTLCHADLCSSWSK